MTTLWAGGEDISFPTNTPSVDTVAGRFESYNRCALNQQNKGTTAVGLTFPGGAITSGWHGCKYYTIAHNSTARRIAGLGYAASGNKGIFFGLASGNATWGIYSYDGSTETQLATGGAVNIGVLTKVDLQLISYGAAGTINVFVAGSLVATYTGDITISGVSGFDCVMLGPKENWECPTCEHVVADADTRSKKVVTHYPNGVGSLNEWNGAYTDIDETTISDADNINIDAVNKTFEAAMSNSPAGTYSVDAIMIVARAYADAAATPQTLKLGVKSGSVDSDAGHVLTESFASYQRLAATINGGPMTTTLLDAMEIDLQSAA